MSQSNVKRTIIAALNLCVPKKIQACGRRNWSATLQGQPVLKNNPRPSQKSVWQDHADEKKMNEANWAAAYNPNETIEDLYDRLEECFVVALVAKPAYTMDQMVDKALIAV